MYEFGLFCYQNVIAVPIPQANNIAYVRPLSMGTDKITILFPPIFYVLCPMKDHLWELDIVLAPNRMVIYLQKSSVGVNLSSFL